MVAKDLQKYLWLDCGAIKTAPSREILRPTSGLRMTVTIDAMLISDLLRPTELLLHIRRARRVLVEYAN